MEEQLQQGAGGTRPSQIGAPQQEEGNCETDPLLSTSSQVAENGKPASGNFTIGATYALLTAFCAVGMSSSAKFAGKEKITPYTSNEVTSVVGTIMLAVIILVQKKSFIPEMPNWKMWFFWYGVALWFFMWGTFRALHLMDLASWMAMTASFNQGLIMILAAGFLSEVIDMFKVCVLARNALVIALIIKPPFLFGGDSLKVSGAGVLFLLVQTTGCAVGAVFQRRLSEYAVEPLLFWGFLANVVYWLPPGVSPPEARVPFLWPTTSKDHSQLHFWTMAYPFMAGVFEVMWYVFSGYGLKYMNAANFFFIMVPCQLVLSCFASATLFHESIDPLSGLALLIIAVGFVVDQWWETKSPFRTGANDTCKALEIDHHAHGA